MFDLILVAAFVPLVFTGCGEVVDQLRSRRLRALMRYAFAEPELGKDACEEAKGVQA